MGGFRRLGREWDLRALGEYQQARVLDEDTLARRRRVLGDDHPDTRASINNLEADLRVGRQVWPSRFEGVLRATGN